MTISPLLQSFTGLGLYFQYIKPRTQMLSPSERDAPRRTMCLWICVVCLGCCCHWYCGRSSWLFCLYSALVWSRTIIPYVCEMKQNCTHSFSQRKYISIIKCESPGVRCRFEWGREREGGGERDVEKVGSALQQNSAPAKPIVCHRRRIPLRNVIYIIKFAFQFAYFILPNIQLLSIFVNSCRCRASHSGATETLHRERQKPNIGSR